jgi:hypothetical protein
VRKRVTEEPASGGKHNRRSSFWVLFLPAIGAPLIGFLFLSRTAVSADDVATRAAIVGAVRLTTGLAGNVVIDHLTIADEPSGVVAAVDVHPQQRSSNSSFDGWSILRKDANGWQVVWAVQRDQRVRPCSATEVAYLRALETGLSAGGQARSHGLKSSPICRGTVLVRP